MRRARSGCGSDRSERPGAGQQRAPRWAAAVPWGLRCQSLSAALAKACCDRCKRGFVRTSGQGFGCSVRRRKHEHFFSADTVPHLTLGGPCCPRIPPSTACGLCEFAVRAIALRLPLLGHPMRLAIVRELHGRDAGVVDLVGRLDGRVAFCGVARSRRPWAIAGSVCGSASVRPSTNRIGW